MIQNLAEYFGSNKTKDAILGSILLIIGDKVGASPETLMAIGGVFGFTVLGRAGISMIRAKKEATVNNSAPAVKT